MNFKTQTLHGGGNGLFPIVRRPRRSMIEPPVMDHRPASVPPPGKAEKEKTAPKVVQATSGGQDEGMPVIASAAPVTAPAPVPQPPAAKAPAAAAPAPVVKPTTAKVKHAKPKSAAKA